MTNDTTDYTARLRALVDARMAAVQPLAARAEAVASARAALDTASLAYAGAWADAITAGWTETELRKVFKEVPAKPAVRRRRARAVRPEQQIPVQPAPTGVES